MPEKSYSQQILDKIQEKHIKPKAKWQFLCKNIFIWLLIVFSLLIGGLATSVIFFMVDNNEWDLYKQLSDSMVAFIFATLPYFWLLMLMLIIIALIYNFKQTKTGYKYKTYSIIVTSVLISIVFGLIFYNIGLADTIDNVFEQKAPLYEKIINNKQQILTQPDKGVLAGNIIDIKENNLLLIDKSHKHWVIELTEVKQQPLLFIQQGAPILILGYKLDEMTFKAEKIKPLYVKQKRWFRINFFHQAQPQPSERNNLQMRINQ